MSTADLKGSVKQCVFWCKQEFLDNSLVCMQILQDIVTRHHAARALVSDSVVDAFMAVRPMQKHCLPGTIV